MITKEKIDLNIEYFNANIIPFGSRDVARAIEVFLEVGKTGEDLAEEVKEFSDGCETPLDKIDVCWIAYETILQEARNKISEVFDYDFLDDGEGDIYTYGNYMCTSYDSAEKTKEALEELFKKATKEQKEQIKEDLVTSWFLEQIDFDLSLLEVKK